MTCAPEFIDTRSRPSSRILCKMKQKMQSVWNWDIVERLDCTIVHCKATLMLVVYIYDTNMGGGMVLMSFLLQSVAMTE